MTNEMSNVPELRFPEFDGEWEEKQLSAILEIGTGKSKVQSNESGKYNILGSTGIIGKSHTYDYEGDFILTARVGHYAGKLYKHAGKVNISDNTIYLFNFINKNFIYESLNVFKLEKLVFGSGQPLIKASDLKKLKIRVPVSKEQKKIGVFFSKLDRQIELEEQKLAKLEEQKKGYMQQIFSQELRFKDENGNDYPNWEEVQLKDILIPRNYKQVPEINAPLMSFTSTGGIEPKGDRYNREFLVKNKNKKYKRTEFNDLIYSSNNLDVGAIGLNRYGTSVISDVYEIFKIEEQVSPYFIEMSILQPEFMYKILRYRQGALYGQYRIHANDFLKINIELPCSEEQYKIGDFVNKLDNIIDIINNKIELLKQRKRGFLQKMFI